MLKRAREERVNSFILVYQIIRLSVGPPYVKFSQVLLVTSFIVFVFKDFN